MQSPFGSSNGSLAQMIIEDNRASRSWIHVDDDLFWSQGASDVRGQNPYHDSGQAAHFGTGVTAKPELKRETLMLRVVPDRSSLTPQTPSSDDLSMLKDHTTKRSNSELKASRDARAAHSWYTRWFRDWWALEIGSMMLGTICIVAIAIMLLRLDGMEMPQWHLGITIDAILSVLAGLSKSCLLMPTAEALGQLKWPFGQEDRKAIDIDRIDRATRGTWGSVLLLTRARGVYVSYVEKV